MTITEEQQDAINNLTPEQADAIVKKYRHLYPIQIKKRNYTHQRIACLDHWAQEQFPN
tara:strand:+ start:423 stop:596 length:174 start_codon:yes stop_codon:yes gene_type:complete